MILCMAPLDDEIIEDAYGGYDKDEYGLPFCYLKGHETTGLLGKTERLYITAHGNDNEIGDADEGASWTAAKLAPVIAAYLPGTYEGSVYISACSSAPNFILDLTQELDGIGAGGSHDWRGRVFGVRGDVDVDIPPHTDAAWEGAL